MIEDYDVNKLIEAVYVGIITKHQLPEQLYLEIANKLNEGVLLGFDLGAPDPALLAELEENIYMFSAAKTYSQVSEMSSALTNEKGISTFKEFEIKAKEIFDLYNKTWLKTEYDTAIGQAQNAKKWAGFEEDKDIFPLLEYDAVMDLNTSEICRPLNGIVLPIGDPFWNTHAPLNHFNCRCFLRQIDKYSDKKITSHLKAKKVSNEVTPLMQDVFKSNPGTSKEIFDKAHPYFNVPRADKDFAKRNFDLPIPKK